MADEFNPKQATGNWLVFNFFWFFKDPHEDKWNRLTVSSRANDLKGAVDVNEKLDDYIAFSRHKISSGLSFQDQAFREMNKHEDKLKSFSKHINNSIILNWYSLRSENIKGFWRLKENQEFPKPSL